MTVKRVAKKIVKAIGPPLIEVAAEEIKTRLNPKLKKALNTGAAMKSAPKTKTKTRAKTKTKRVIKKKNTKTRSG